jgi:hypothetical protein
MDGSRPVVQDLAKIGLVIRLFTLTRKGEKCFCQLSLTSQRGIGGLF